VKRIEVAVGVIFNDQGKVLVGQRIVQDQYFEKWEFPGGKLEAGESATQALARELKEELSIEVQSSQDLMTLDHDYPDRHVKLYVRIVDAYSGEVTSSEGQAIKWVTLSALQGLDFLQGNQPMIERLLNLERAN
jgi:8-oxo-dGTP diphosphatase